MITRPLLFVVRDGDEIVGVRGMYGTTWNLGPGREATVLPHADDLLIREEHRNRGLFLLLHRAMVRAARERGYPAILSLSGVVTTQELSLACGYRPLGDLPAVHRAGTSEAPRRRRLEGRVLRGMRRRGVFSTAFGRGFTVDGLCREIAATSRNPHIEVSRSADLAEMSVLARAVHPLGADRGEDHLRWRLANPDHVYRFVRWADTSLRGFLVLSWDAMCPGRVTIADVVSDDDSVFAELLGALEEPTDIEYLMMSATLTENQASIARAAGFRAAPATSDEQNRRFLYFAVSSGVSLTDEDAPSLDSRWHVSELDLMTS